MIRRFARLLWLCFFALSLGGTTLSLSRLIQDPTLRPLRQATVQEIRAASDRLMAELGTPDYLAVLIADRLDETPRNWVALDALSSYAVENALSLPPDLTQRLTETRQEDFSVLAQITSCAVCAFDAGQCSLTQIFACQAPVALTPVGDLLGVARAGSAYVAGGDVDQVDLALSVVGIGATAAILVSGGSSASVKTGASIVKTARSMGRLSPALLDLGRTAVKNGVDWTGLPEVRSVDELAATLRAEAFLPLTRTVTDLDRMRLATDTTTTLHLLPMVDNATDAHHLAVAAEALGPKIVARAEVLGKARLLRSTMRLTSVTYALATALGGLGLSLMFLAGSLGKSLVIRHLRHL